MSPLYTMAIISSVIATIVKKLSISHNVYIRLILNTQNDESLANNSYMYTLNYYFFTSVFIRYPR